jgi:hypothetical protein
MTVGVAFVNALARFFECSFGSGFPLSKASAPGAFTWTPGITILSKFLVTEWPQTRAICTPRWVRLTVVPLVLYANPL